MKGEGDTGERHKITKLRRELSISELVIRNETLKEERKIIKLSRRNSPDTACSNDRKRKFENDLERVLIKSIKTENIVAKKLNSRKGKLEKKAN